jgi:hypothetical protein
MIRTKCPHCGKLLGINDSAAGTVALCPLCKKKFRVPRSNPAVPPKAKSPASPPAAEVEEFPYVEVDDEGDGAAPKQAAPASPSRKRRLLAEEDVAQRDEPEDDDKAEPEDEPRTRKSARKGKKKKRDREKESAAMVLRNRIVGAVGALAGFGMLAYGLAVKEIPQISDRFGDPGRYVVIGFGGLMGVVGVYYVFRR